MERAARTVSLSTTVRNSPLSTLCSPTCDDFAPNNSQTTNADRDDAGVSQIGDDIAPVVSQKPRFQCVRGVHWVSLKREHSFCWPGVLNNFKIRTVTFHVHFAMKSASPGVKHQRLTIATKDPPATPA